MGFSNLNKEKAKAHYEDVKVRFAKETAASIQGTKVYGPEPVRRNFRTYKPEDGRIELVDEGSVSCLFNRRMHGKVAILNYASYKFPGGLYLQGSFAQEEALCHESNLFPILLAFDDSYYAWNKKNLNKALYRNRALYVPNVVFEHGGKTATADVITCASPNYSTAGFRCGVSRADNDIIMEDRIRFMLSVAEDNQVGTLIAGAWGCGVFGQNPYTVCKLLNDNIIKGCYGISNVYYAIPGGSYDGNYVAFEEEVNNVSK